MQISIHTFVQKVTDLCVGNDANFWISIHTFVQKVTATFSISWKLLQQMQVLAAIYGTAYCFSASTNSIFPYILVRNQGKTAACFRFAQAAFVFPPFVFWSLLYQIKPAYRSFLSLRISFYVLSNSQQGMLLQIPCVLGKLLRQTDEKCPKH